jgi:arginine decarboxylase
MPDGSPEYQRAQETIAALIQELALIESYWGFPGKEGFAQIARQFHNHKHVAFHQSVLSASDQLDSGEYRRKAVEQVLGFAAPKVLYFDVLVVSQLRGEEEKALLKEMYQWRSGQDGFVYNLVVVTSFVDALIAVMFNFDIQAVVIHDYFDFESRGDVGALEGLRASLRQRGAAEFADHPNPALLLGEHLHELRPELNLFLSTKVSPEELAGMAKSYFDRIFHRYESGGELHLSIIKAIGARYETPFFDALKNYSREPVGTFHALPIARGNSVAHSPWMRDFFEFYGRDIFLAESSATTGGLDSLLQPTGTLKRAQEKASRCFGSNQTHFVTNGTSTSVKIVLQALTRPGDIVLVDRSCHESHHFGFLLSGACPLYLENYTLDRYSIAGAVQLANIKRVLLELGRKGLLDKVKLIDLTNCTFDGLVYNVQRYMREILAIKPDIIFLWDEAWFAFARFVPHYRQRTAMHAAATLAEWYRSPQYRQQYEAHKADVLCRYGPYDDALAEQCLMPDPDKVRIRVYATQSTHKTLSCFRQGSMIHIHDEDFSERVRDQFTKAYFTHTTTSPNYQILASLDAARRQVHLEGYELVQRHIEMAIIIRKAINEHPLLSRYFKALGVAELIPEQFRTESGVTGIGPWETIARAWEVDLFVLDPCRVTVYTAKTGVSGFILRTRHLAEKYNIQVNKTGLNTFCLMTNIGTTRSSVAYLIESLIHIAEEFERRDKDMSREERLQFEHEHERVLKLPPLPNFGGFHPAFLLNPATRAGDLRRAFYEGYDPDNVEHVTVARLDQLLDTGRELVAATYIIPVPPGFPLLVPGQILDRETVRFLQALSPNEILGLDPALGIRFFTDSYLGGAAAQAKACAPAANAGASGPTLSVADVASVLESMQA